MNYRYLGKIETPHDVNKLNKNFGYGQLFEGVSFSLNEGESISIVGPNALSQLHQLL